DLSIKGKSFNEPSGVLICIAPCCLIISPLITNCQVNILKLLSVGTTLAMDTKESKGYKKEFFVCRARTNILVNSLSAAKRSSAFLDCIILASTGTNESSFCSKTFLSSVDNRCSTKLLPAIKKTARKKKILCIKMILTKKTLIRLIYCKL